MKSYTKPTLEVIAFRADEQIAAPPSGRPPQADQNNGHGNGDQDAPGGSLPNNGAENDQTP